MQQYIIRRVLLNFLVLFLVATMVFAALRIDSDTVVTQRAGFCFTGGTDPALIERCKTNAKAELGLLDSIPEQYGTFLWDLSPVTYEFPFLKTPDLGSSTTTRNPIIDEIGERALPSIELGILQILIALVVALPIGVISAVKQDGPVDYFLRFFSIALLGIPVFVVAVIIIMLTSRYADGTFLADWFGPHREYVELWEDPVQHFKILFAPALIAGLATGAIIMRFLRSQMLEVLRQDYVRTAWAKGLKERVVIIRHALKNALIPVLTIIGILLGNIVSGNVVLEVIYRIPGLGFYIVASITQNPNFPAVQGVVIVVAAVLVFVNLFIDILYGWLDPRIRYS